MAAETAILEAAHTQAEVRREAAQMLGGAGGLGEFRLPALTAGRLALLDVIDSPVLDPAGQPTRLDAIRALYVLAVGPDAVAPVTRALRHAQGLEQAREHAGRSPEMFREWLAYVELAGEGWVEFDQRALVWLDGSGIQDLAAALGALAQALEDAVRGFAIVPAREGEDQQPPFADGSAPSGSPACTPAPEAAGP